MITSKGGARCIASSGVRNSIEFLAEYYDQADAARRESILQAIEALDESLAADPLEIGESRTSQNIRIVLEHPFAVTYRVDVDHRFVRVTAVGFFRPRS